MLKIKEIFGGVLIQCELRKKKFRREQPNS